MLFILRSSVFILLLTNCFVVNGSLQNLLKSVGINGSAEIIITRKNFEKLITDLFTNNDVDKAWAGRATINKGKLMKNIANGWKSDNSLETKETTYSTHNDTSKIKTTDIMNYKNTANIQKILNKLGKRKKKSDHKINKSKVRNSKSIKVLNKQFDKSTPNTKDILENSVKIIHSHKNNADKSKIFGSDKHKTKNNHPKGTKNSFSKKVHKLSNKKIENKEIGTTKTITKKEENSDKKHIDKKHKTKLSKKITENKRNAATKTGLRKEENRDKKHIDAKHKTKKPKVIKSRKFGTLTDGQHYSHEELPVKIRLKASGMPKPQNIAKALEVILEKIKTDKKLFDGSSIQKKLSQNIPDEKNYD